MTESFIIPYKDKLFSRRKEKILRFDRNNLSFFRRFSYIYLFFGQQVVYI